MIRELANKIWYTFLRYFFTATFYPLFRIKAKGNKDVPLKGPLLILSNHQSFFDPIFCQVPIGRNFHYVARKTLFQSPIWGRLLLTLNTIPIKQGVADLTAMKKIIEKLKNGSAVCLFPEATRTSDGKIAEIKPGFSLLVRRSGATVIPMVIDGAFECWPRTQKFPKLGKVRTSYGRPITAQQVKELGDEKFTELLTETLRKLQHDLRLEAGKEPFQY